MPRARATLVFLLTILGACHDPPPLPEPRAPGANAPGSVAEPAVPEAARVGLPAAAPETGAVVRARWSPVAQEVLGQPFATALLRGEPGLRVELEVEPDRSAIDRVARGEAAFAVVVDELTAHDLQRGLQAMPCGRYVPVLVVNESNPLRSVNARAMREAVTGQARSWQTVGGRGGAIELGVPAATPLRQRAAALLVPGDRFAGDAVRLAGDQAVLDFVRARPNALGLVGSSALGAAAGVRALAIEGALPDAVGYRWQAPVSLVARSTRDAATERVLARLRRVRT